jgi:hypothetical protein
MQGGVGGGRREASPYPDPRRWRSRAWGYGRRIQRACEAGDRWSLGYFYRGNHD